VKGRILIDYVLPLILPTLLYVAVQLWRRSHAGAGANVSPVLRTAPWGRLAAVGLLLAAASLSAVALFGGAPPGKRYVLAHVEDGAVAPGSYVTLPARK
jgi:Family of unknown function (DUF6111)